MMDAAELVSAMPPAGAPMPLTENTARIDAVVVAWNEQFDWPGGEMPDTGGVDSSGGGGSAEDTGGTGDGGQDGEGGSDSGCGCASDRPSRGASGAFLLLALAGLRRRRRG
jgi:MYXO-CTERM domain-containing protein